MEALLLLADGDATTRNRLAVALARAGCRVEATQDLPGLAARADKDGRGLVILAHHADGDAAQAALDRLTAARPDMPVVTVAAPGARTGAEGPLAQSMARHLRRYFERHEGELPPPGLHQRILREVEAPLIEIALAATGGNQARCAELLGINRNTLRKKMAELDIRVTRRRKLM